MEMLGNESEVEDGVQRETEIEIEIEMKKQRYRHKVVGEGQVACKEFVRILSSSVGFLKKKKKD